MALSYFGFSCDPVRGDRDLVLVRTDGCIATKFWSETYARDMRRFDVARRCRLTTLPALKYRGVSDASFSFGVVVFRRDAAAVCLDLLRRDVKPWADPRRRRAA